MSRTTEDQVEAQDPAASPGRGIGPFSGRQLTAIILGGLLIAAVGIPTAVSATGGSPVIIQDGSGSNTNADVTPVGALQTATAAPANFYWNVAQQLPSGKWTQVAAATSTQALVASEVYIDNGATSGGAYNFTLAIFPGGNCTGSWLPYGFQEYMINQQQETMAPLSPGIAVPASADVCAIWYGPAGAANVTVSGYYVPAASVPSNH